MVPGGQYVRQGGSPPNPYGYQLLPSIVDHKHKMAAYAGVQIYQYTKGMMHAKVMLIDDDFASVGTANLDNRSMFLNFEVNCLLYSTQAVHKLEASFLADFRDSIKLERSVYAKRPFAGRLLENACRLLSPVL